MLFSVTLCATDDCWKFPLILMVNVGAKLPEEFDLLVHKLAISDT